MAQNWNIEMSQAFYMEVWNGYERSRELEEENKKLKDDLRIAQWLVEKYEEIEIKMGKENKNLKLIQETNEKQLKNDIKERDELREENKNLNIKVASLEWEIKWLNYTIEQLKEENQTLELWLDNKEKLNKRYRKQIDKYKRQYEHSMWFMEEDTLQELKDIWEL